MRMSALNPEVVSINFQYNSNKINEHVRFVSCKQYYVNTVLSTIKVFPSNDFFN